MSDLLLALVSFIIVIPSAIIHEYAHGWMAERLGDPTARYAGRMTMNPLAHIDLVGTILLPITLLLLSGGQFMFGYAKPVPYNPYNLKNQKWGPVMVGLAGPAANLLLAICFSVLARLNLFSDPIFSAFILQIILINVVLAIFNLVPIPPLDGSKVLYALLPDSWQGIKYVLDRYGFVLVLFFVFFLFDLLTPIIDWVVKILVG